MRPIEELLGKTVNTITVEEIGEELRRRWLQYLNQKKWVETYQENAARLVELNDEWQQIGLENIPTRMMDDYIQMANTNNESMDSAQKESKQLLFEVVKLSDELCRLQGLKKRTPSDMTPEHIEGYIVGVQAGILIANAYGGVKKNKKIREIRVECIKEAARIWKREPDARTGDVKRALYHYQKELGVNPVSNDTMGEWIKEAVEDGFLNKPEAASRPGRNEK